MGDHPRGVTVTASADGVRWRAVRSSGTGQFVEADLRGQPVRHVRITLTAEAPTWWSVADVRAYR